jgi:bifunctional ADP-heptose synthase (sugar kinase/adenylyltransferase)
LLLAAGLKLHDLAAVANLAGGLVCEKVGVVPVDKARLLEEITRIESTLG